MKKLKMILCQIFKYIFITVIMVGISTVMLLDKYDTIMSICLMLFFIILCIISVISTYTDIKKERRDKLMQLQWERKRIKEKINAESKL